MMWNWNCDRCIFATFDNNIDDFQVQNMWIYQIANTWIAIEAATGKHPSHIVRTTCICTNCDYCDRFCSRSATEDSPSVLSQANGHKINRRPGTGVSIFIFFCSFSFFDPFCSIRFGAHRTTVVRLCNKKINIKLKVMKSEQTDTEKKENSMKRKAVRHSSVNGLNKIHLVICYRKSQMIWWHSQPSENAHYAFMNKCAVEGKCGKKRSPNENERKKKALDSINERAQRDGALAHAHAHTHSHTWWHVHCVLGRGHSHTTIGQTNKSKSQQ